MFVRPTSGRMCRRPDTRVLMHRDGEVVPNAAYWVVRGIRDKDLEECDPPEPASVAQAVEAGAGPPPDAVGAEAQRNRVAICASPSEPLAAQETPK